MDTENSNLTTQSERDKLNEQLDELRQDQQERKLQKKTRSRWKRLLGFMGVISSLFLLGTSCSKPTVTCYRRAEDPDEEEASVEENDVDFDDEPVELCYVYIEDDYIDSNKKPVPNPDSNLYDPELEAHYDNLMGINNEPETKPEVSDSDAALEEVQQYYEKVKRESFLNNIDNAETNDQPTE